MMTTARCDSEALDAAWRTLWFAPWRGADPSWREQATDGAPWIALERQGGASEHLSYRLFCLHYDLPLLAPPAAPALRSLPAAAWQAAQLPAVQLFLGMAGWAGTPGFTRSGLTEPWPMPAVRWSGAPHCGWRACGRWRRWNRISRHRLTPRP